MAVAIVNCGLWKHAYVSKVFGAGTRLTLSVSCPLLLRNRSTSISAQWWRPSNFPYAILRPHPRPYPNRASLNPRGSRGFVLRRSLWLRHCNTNKNYILYSDIIWHMLNIVYMNGKKSPQDWRFSHAHLLLLRASRGARGIEDEKNALLRAEGELWRDGFRHHVRVSRPRYLWTMDDVILVRCGRDVPLESFISLLEDDSATFSEGRCERKDSNSKSELNTASYETESAELWILADNGQLLKVADINRVVQIEDLKLTKESR